MRTTVLVGNPRPGSRTAAAALAAARRVGAAAGRPGTPEAVDLAELAPVLLARPRPPAVDAALARVAGSELLVVASPTYKATYTGLLKVFFDLLPADALRGVVAVPLLVMGSPAHTLAVEVHLRPVLVELGATVPAPGLALVEADLGRLDAVLGPWAAHVGPRVRAALPARADA
ncbi:NAD(P)H-dependent oxidoreductase [Nocardiopsis trehalosi]|uniref:NAD(P)H-dependent oxidoreductase n=1 Tax=Nocardiopsis trehalosi TaxID=109329 RepID=UPI00082A926B|nr:NAD(P)H-dependent oxidoreductase [Nocardiopsis trehalosi]